MILDYMIFFRFKIIFLHYLEKTTEMARKHDTWIWMNMNIYITLILSNSYSKRCTAGLLNVRDKLQLLDTYIKQVISCFPLYT